MQIACPCQFSYACRTTELYGKSVSADRFQAKHAFQTVRPLYMVAERWSDHGPCRCHLKTVPLVQLDFFHPLAATKEANIKNTQLA